MKIPKQPNDLPFKTLTYSSWLSLRFLGGSGRLRFDLIWQWLRVRTWTWCLCRFATCLSRFATRLCRFAWFCQWATSCLSRFARLSWCTSCFWPTAPWSHNLRFATRHWPYSLGFATWPWSYCGWSSLLGQGSSRCGGCCCDLWSRSWSCCYWFGAWCSTS